MPTFEYTARNMTNGQILKGTFEGKSKDELLISLFESRMERFNHRNSMLRAGTCNAPITIAGTSWRLTPTEPCKDVRATAISPAMWITTIWECANHRLRHPTSGACL